MSPLKRITAHLSTAALVATFSVAIPFVGLQLPAIAASNDSQCELPGYGLEDYPYFVDSVEDFAEISDCDGLGIYFLQTRDIDFQNSPVSAGDFRGHYEGGNNVLRGLSFTDTAVDRIGTFRTVYSGASLRNISIHNSSFAGKAYVGALAAEISENVLIENITIYDVQVSGEGAVGGMSGGLSSSASSVILQNVVVTSMGNVGGLAGQMLLSPGTEENPAPVRLQKISMATEVNHPAGNPSTGLGGLTGVLVANNFSKLEITQVAIEAALNDQGASTMAGALIGFQGNSPTSFGLEVNEVVIDVNHTVTNPSDDRPLTLLSGTLFAASSDVNRVVANLVSEASGADQSIDLLDRDNNYFSLGTTISSTDVYFNTTLHPSASFRYTTGATAKSAAELTTDSLFSDWSITNDFNQLFFETDDFDWYKQSDSYPWVAFAAARSHGHGDFFRIAHLDNIANAGQLGEFELNPLLIDGEFYLRIAAVESGTSNVIALDPTEELEQTIPSVGATDLLLRGTMRQLNADIKKVALENAAGMNADLTFSISSVDDAATILHTTTITLEVLGCVLSGSGTEADPYLINAESDLRKVLACDDQGVHFELTQDINLQRPHVPIGTYDHGFEGVFDGAGFSINNLRTNNPDSSGQALFGVTGDGGGTITQTVIKNLTVRGVVSGVHDVALLVGDVDDLNTSNVNLYGKVSGFSSIGLLAGDAENLKAVGVVAEGRAIGEFDEVGLLVGNGEEDDMWFEDIRIAGQVLGNERVGGMAGILGDEDNDTGLIRDVVALVDVIATVYQGSSDQEQVGGLVGSSTWMRYFNIDLAGLQIDENHTGRVLGHEDPEDPGNDKERFGGLIGESYGDTVRDVDVMIDVITENPSSGDLNVGGLIGEAGRLELRSSEYLGEVRGHENVGGVIGILNHDGLRINGNSFVSDVSARVEVHGVRNDIGGFAGSVNHGNDLDESTWIEDVFIDGTVTASENATIGGFIGDVDVYDNVGASDNWAGEITILRSGSSADVTSLTSTEAGGGFIGYVENASPLLIEDCYATGDVRGYSQIGGFIGEIISGNDADAQVTIRRSFASGNVEGSIDVGGFVGWLDADDEFPESTNIDQSFSSGNVEGVRNVGGFIGDLDGGVITNSYADGIVLGEGLVGGFVGSANNFTEIEFAFTSGSAALKDSSDTTSSIGPFIGSFQFASLSRVAYYPDLSSADEYPQATDGDEILLSSANWDDVATYQGWNVAQTLDAGESDWLICPNIVSVRMILWFEAELNQSSCNGTSIPAPPSSLNTGGTALDFDFFAHRGTFAEVGYSATYMDIIAGSEYQVDAKVTVLAIQNVDSAGCSSNTQFDPPNNLLGRLDWRSSNPERNRWLALQLEDLCLNDQDEAFTELKFEFFIGSQSVELEQVVLDITDIDDMQFVEVSNFDRYSLSEDSILRARVVNGVTRIEETQDLDTSTSGTTEDFDFIGSALTVGRAQFEFDSASEITVRAGATKDGAAYFDFDFSSGGEWVDTRGTVEILTLENPVVEVEAVDLTAAPYDGPVVFEVNPQTVLSTGGEIELIGTNLETVSRIQIDGVNLVLDKVEPGRIAATVPSGLTLGLKDVELTSDFGKLSISDLIRVVAQGDEEFLAWTSLKGDFVKVYAKNLIGAGKVQFMVNGVERAWVRAIDQSDPKLRRANGFDYLVRSVTLKPGKNVFEVYLDGERVWRSAYTPS